MPYRTSILTVTGAASDYSLVSLAVAKDELGITDGAQDTRIERWIVEESRKIFRCVDRVLVQETVTETFRLVGWPSNHFNDAPGEHFYPRDHESVGIIGLHVGRYPIVSVTSLLVDGVPLDLSNDIEIDASPGLIYRLSGSNRIPWSGQLITIAYSGGYPASAIPDDLQAACLLSVKHRLAARTRDPMVRSINVPGVLEQQFWVGAQPGGEVSSLPPEVEAALEGYREFHLL